MELRADSKIKFMLYSLRKFYLVMSYKKTEG